MALWVDHTTDGLIRVRVLLISLYESIPMCIYWALLVDLTLFRLGLVLVLGGEEPRAEGEWRRCRLFGRAAGEAKNNRCC